MTRTRRVSSVRLEGLRKRSAGSMLSDCLSRVLSTAREESNLICGVASVAEALESDVGASLCVVAMNDSEHNEPAVQIYFKLIEAYCIEYGFHLLKVDSSSLLGKWAKQSFSAGLRTSQRCSCVLITGDKYSKGVAILRNYCLQEGGVVCKTGLHLRGDSPTSVLSTGLQ